MDKQEEKKNLDNQTLNKIVDFFKYYFVKIEFLTKYKYTFLYLSLTLTFIFVFFYYKSYQKSKELRKLYYSSINRFFDKVEINPNESSKRLTDEEILNLVNHYKKLIIVSMNSPESYFSLMNLSKIYTMVENYEESIFYLEKLKQNIKKNSYFYPQVSMSLGHLFLNFAFLNEKKAILKDQRRIELDSIVIKNYMAAIKTYENLLESTKDKENHLVFPIIYKYLALAYEKKADIESLFSSLKKDQSILDMYQKANNFYRKFKWFIDNKKQGYIYGINETKKIYSFILESIIRTNVKINKYKKR